LSNWKHKRKVQRRYDLTARMYDSRYTEEQEAKYQAALADVKLEGLVLDVGCGTGLFFNHISSKAKTIIGVDISKGLLLLAAERAKLRRNVNLVQADADHLPFKNDVFGTVFTFTLLQNMPTPLETLAELRRTARRGAAVTVTGLKKTFSLETLKELLRQAALRLVSIKDEENLKCYVALTLNQSSN
jgi:ubiquinone/menaquinone biosynthesis C-methylase UbiE